MVCWVSFLWLIKKYPFLPMDYKHNPLFNHVEFKIRCLKFCLLDLFTGFLFVKISQIKEQDWHLSHLKGSFYGSFSEVKLFCSLWNENISSWQSLSIRATSPMTLCKAKLILLWNKVKINFFTDQLVSDHPRVLESGLNLH